MPFLPWHILRQCYIHYCYAPVFRTHILTLRTILLLMLFLKSQCSSFSIVDTFLLPTFPRRGMNSKDGEAPQSQAVVSELESVRRSKVPKTTAGTSATGRQADPKCGRNAYAAGRTTTSVLRVDRSTLNVHEYWNAHAGLTMRALSTMADGACSVHAVVGNARGGRIQHADPRGWIRNVLAAAGSFADVAAMCQTLQHSSVWNAITSTLENELLLSFVRGVADTEAQCFGEHLLRLHSDVITETLEAMHVDSNIQMRRQAAQAAAQRSARQFSRPANI